MTTNNNQEPGLLLSHTSSRRDLLILCKEYYVIVFPSEKISDTASDLQVFLIMSYPTIQVILCRSSIISQKRHIHIVQ